MKKLLTFLTGFCVVMLLTAASADSTRTVIVYDIVNSDGSHILTAGKPGKAVSLKAKDGVKYQLIGQRQNSTIKVILRRAGKDPSAPTEHLAEAQTLSGGHISLSAPGLSPLMDIVVEEMSVDKAREKLKGAGALCLSSSSGASLLQTSSAAKNTSPVPTIRPSGCCVTCENITVCGCAVSMSCGSCCSDDCC